MYDIIIVGAGTAGMSAAIYGVRAGKTVLVIEEKSYGGQIINSSEIENYPGIIRTSGFEFATNLYQQIKELGADLVYEQVQGIDEKVENGKNLKKVITNKNQYEAKSVIIATGAKNRLLNIEKEKELTGLGVSYCAACDGMFFKDKEVAVVGGGNTALEDAVFLSNYCKKVYIIHRRDKFRGEENTVDTLRKRENVEFIMDSAVVKLHGDERLEKITVQSLKEGLLKEIPVSAVFIAIGRVPANDIFSDIVELDANGYIKADESCKTNALGIFAAGDCRTKKVRQLTTAASDGAVAALAAAEYIDY